MAFHINLLNVTSIMTDPNGHFKDSPALSSLGQTVKHDMEKSTISGATGALFDRFLKKNFTSIRRICAMGDLEIAEMAVTMGIDVAGPLGANIIIDSSHIHGRDTITTNAVHHTADDNASTSETQGTVLRLHPRSCEISARDGRWCTVRGFPISERFPPNSQPGISPLRGNGGRQGPSRHRGGDHLRPPRPGRRPRIFDDYNTRDAGRPFLPNRAFPGREEDEDEEDEEDFRSQSSNHSFVRTRLSPDIVYPLPPPYHGRPLRTTRRAGRYDHDTDGEDEDVDEHFRRRGAHMGRRRASFGLGRERFLGGGRRDYEDDGLGHTFGGDEDDVFDV
ncbi:hypothetical protein IMSHALPRED_010562 [Imshaugia aleurites]|uniref:Uncharacterized protein n=1 Tax=Imshaugia aleurites TaxID=172621 RepID=A0A8H3EUN2_9LECA|nr:hypothetical protein IMSHALPRED_010562 [Imshaugia aleurites]